MRWTVPTAMALFLATAPAGEVWAQDGDILRRLKRPAPDAPVAAPVPFDISNLSEGQREAIASAAARAGQNCPKVSGAKKDSEDASGWVIRVSCSSTDGRHRWDLRLTGYPHGKPHFAPW